MEMQSDDLHLEQNQEMLFISKFCFYTLTFPKMCQCYPSLPYIRHSYVDIDCFNSEDIDFMIEFMCFHFMCVFIFHFLCVLLYDIHFHNNNNKTKTAYTKIAKLGTMTVHHDQWRRNRGFRRFNEPGPPNSWGPRVVGPQNFLGKNNIVLYVTLFACFIHYEKYCLHCVNCTKFGH